MTDPSLTTVTQERRTKVRCPSDNITRGEFANFTRKLDDRLENQDVMLDKFNTALFAEDEKNVNHQPGLMHTARNIDQHITSVCNIAKWVWRTLATLLGVAVPLTVLAKAMGWI